MGALGPDLLLTDAAFLTVDQRRPRADWMVVYQGRIVALGDGDDRPQAHGTLSPPFSPRPRQPA